jgi:peptidoglycan/LPS O-acetylase OafA/YrhL
VTRHLGLQGNAFDHVRLGAAFMVLYSHHFALWGLPEPATLGGTVGHLGLGIFFSLSGYLVSISLASDPHAGRFLMRRVLRILPGLTVNVLFCVFILGLALTRLPLADYLRHPTTQAFFLNLLFSPRFALPGVMENAPHPFAINGSLWTLPFELLGYLVLAAGGVVLGRKVRWICPILAALCAALSVLWQPSEPLVVWANDLRHVPSFLAWFFAGATLAHVGANWLQIRHLAVLLAAFVLIPHSVVQQVLTILIVPLLTLCLGQQPVARQFALKRDCSYGVYLYAFPIQQLIITELGGIGFWASMVLAALLTWTCARLSWSLVEEPMLRFKPRRPGRPIPMVTVKAGL